MPAHNLILQHEVKTNFGRDFNFINNQYTDTTVYIDVTPFYTGFQNIIQMYLSRDEAYIKDTINKTKAFYEYIDGDNSLQMVPMTELDIIEPCKKLYNLLNDDNFLDETVANIKSALKQAYDIIAKIVNNTLFSSASIATQDQNIKHLEIIKPLINFLMMLFKNDTENIKKYLDDINEYFVTDNIYTEIITSRMSPFKDVINGSVTFQVFFQNHLKLNNDDDDQDKDDIMNFLDTIRKNEKFYFENNTLDNPEQSHPITQIYEVIMMCTSIIATNSYQSVFVISNINFSTIFMILKSLNVNKDFYNFIPHDQVEFVPFDALISISTMCNYLINYNTNFNGIAISLNNFKTDILDPSPEPNFPQIMFLQTYYTAYIALCISISAKREDLIQKYYNKIFDGRMKGVIDTAPSFDTWLDKNENANAKTLYSFLIAGIDQNFITNTNIPNNIYSDALSISETASILVNKDASNPKNLTLLSIPKSIDISIDILLGIYYCLFLFEYVWEYV